MIFLTRNQGHFLWIPGNFFKCPKTKLKNTSKDWQSLNCPVKIHLCACKNAHNSWGIWIFAWECWQSPNFGHLPLWSHAQSIKQLSIIATHTIGYDPSQTVFPKWSEECLESRMLHFQILLTQHRKQELTCFIQLESAKRISEPQPLADLVEKQLRSLFPLACPGGGGGGGRVRWETTSCPVLQGIPRVRQDY